jgi:hypothetical protein
MELWGSGVMKINSVITKMDEKSIEKLIVLVPQEEINILKKPETGLLIFIDCIYHSFNFHL